MKEDTYWRIATVGLITLFIGVLAGLGMIIVREVREHARCEDAGGRIEKYDCSTMYMMQPCGSGCSIMVPVENCSERCVGASPEMP